jgi:hypothetical protein
MVIGRLFGRREEAFEAGIRELAEFTREVGGGRIGPAEVRADGVYVPLEATDGERYVLRVAIAPARYLTVPPSCTFVGPDYRPAHDAWPAANARGPFRSPRFICTSPTAEYHRLHPEHPYRCGQGSLVETVSVVFVALHGPGYCGRSGRR